jgi:phospholipid/cholesterol/gamma-HCH transport system ATP-binding protein
VINELIVILQRELHVTSIVVTHDMQSAFKIADRIVMLYDGRIIFDGTPAQVRATEDDIVKRFVLGEASERDLQALHIPSSEAGKA